VGFTQTVPSRPCPNLKVTLAYGAEIACSEATGAKRTVASGTVLAADRMKSPLKLHVRGDAAGDCTVTATAAGTPGPGWRFAAPATLAIRVERFTLSAFRYRDGGSMVDGGDALLADGGPVRKRELHQRNNNIFTFARFVMAAPTAKFWDKAGSVTLSGNGRAAIFSDKAATTALAELREADFADGAATFWVTTTAKLTWSNGPRKNRRKSSSAMSVAARPSRVRTGRC
jgi:hypothetical protein